MLSPLRLLRLSWHGLRLLADPTHLPSVFGIVKAVNTPEQLAEQRRRLQAHPRAAAALVNRPRVGALDLDALEALPAGTLGHAFARFLRDRNLSPEVLTDQTLGEAEWVSVHMYETHDLWHVVTGFDSDTLGEVTLQSFILAQMPWERLAPFLLSVALLRAGLGHPEFTAADVHAAIARGRAVGEQADLIFGYDWASAWERPLADVRRELGFAEEAARRAA